MLEGMKAFFGYCGTKCQTKIAYLKTSKFTKGLFDDVFKVLEAVGFVLWMVHEFVSDPNKTYLFLAIVFALAGASYVLAHKIISNKYFATITWLVYLGWICLWRFQSSSSSPQVKLALFLGPAQPSHEHILLGTGATHLKGRAYKITDLPLVMIPMPPESGSIPRHYILGTNPVVTYDPSGSNSIPLSFHLQNIGNATAKNVQVFVSCDDSVQIKLNGKWRQAYHEPSMGQHMVGYEPSGSLKPRDIASFDDLYFIPSTNILVYSKGLMISNDATGNHYWFYNYQSEQPFYCRFSVQLEADDTDTSIVNFGALFYLSLSNIAPYIPVTQVMSNGAFNFDIR